MYQALYRKYRPKQFEDVVGQEHITETLKNQLRLDRVHHAYLFTGSRGTGKTTCAKILAKAVNCLSPENADPCGRCDNCRGIDAGEILDVVEMDAASNRGIDDVRAIIDEVNFAPARAKYRVYIIDEAHMITPDAWNALLKTLEEPPAHVIFIFATTEVAKVPVTIRSRCQRFDFRRITPRDIEARVKLVCEKESVGITDEAALLISVIADGALRDALSILDRCIALNSDVTADVVRKAAGLASNVHLFEICDCIISKNAAKALERVDMLYNESKNMMGLTDELTTHLRSLMLIKTVRDPRELLVMSDREFEAARAQSDYLSLADIVYFMDVLARAYSRMPKSVNPRFELEMALVKLCAPELDATDEALTARVAALEKTVKLLAAGARPQPVVPVSDRRFVTEPEQPRKAETSAAVAVTREEPETPVPKTPAPETPVPETLASEAEAEPERTPEQEKTPEELVAEKLTPKEPTATEIEPEQPAALDEESPEAPVTETPQETPHPLKANEGEALEQTPSVSETSDEKLPVQPPQPKKAAVDMKALYENAEPFSLWKDVLASIKSYSVAIYSAFADSNAYVSGDYILIETDSEIAFKLLRDSAQRKNIRTAIMETTGRGYRLGPYKKPEEEQKKDDVLDSFIEKLRAKGVNVTEE